MTERVSLEQSSNLKSLLAGFAIMIVAFGSATATSAQVVVDQKVQSAPVKPPLMFDVVSVKLNKSGSENINIYSPTSGDGMNLTNVALSDIVTYAYGIQSFDLLSGLPDWAKSDRYDIQAKVADSDVARFRSLNETQRQLMIQALLADRFKLTTHREPKSIAVYALIVAKNGPKMTEVKPGDPHPNGLKESDGTSIKGPSLNGTGPGEETAQEISMGVFAGSLSRIAGRQVIDKTGLKGTYDFKLKFSREQSTQIDSGAQAVTLPSEMSGPSIFTALQEQLGLKLDPQKLLMPSLVIDNVERPSDN